MDKQLLEFKRSDVFTPDDISKEMSKYLHNKGNLLEPSVGTGNLLKFVEINKYENIDIYDIKKIYLDKCINNNNINKFCCDFLKKEIKYKYSNIILNPPYIKIQDLSKDYIKFIKNKWKIFKKGNIDIYYVFLYKCLKLLKDDGIMVSITPNSYLYNKSSLIFRKYLIENNYIEKIIDYNCKQIFKNVSVYCCITIFSKRKKGYIIYNNKKYNYNDIDNINYNILNKKINKKINNLSNYCKVSNGIATLKNNIYIHKNKLYNENCWKEILTPKGIKFVIYPYENNNIIKENKFKTINPLTYKYLLENKEILQKRDKGKKKYEEWYAYGRKQGIKICNDKKVLYIPVFCNIKNMKIIIDKPMLHVSYLIVRVNNKTIEEVKDIINKNKKYIYNNSSKRGGDWINISSRTIKNIQV